MFVNVHTKWTSELFEIIITENTPNQEMDMLENVTCSTDMRTRKEL